MLHCQKCQAFSEMVVRQANRERADDFPEVRSGVVWNAELLRRKAYSGLAGSLSAFRDEATEPAVEAPAVANSEALYFGALTYP